MRFNSFLQFLTTKCWFSLIILLTLTDPLISVGLSSNVKVTPPEFDHGVDLPTARPLNIGHQGSCGQLPSHTVESYQLAVDEGADVIECDVTITKDLHLICSHESWISSSTNIADVYPAERMSTYYIIDKDVNITDYFTVDFTLEELKQVRVVQRETFRNQNHNGLYEMASLEEYIQVAQNAGRPVGIYPETKEPIWTNSLSIIQDAGTTFEDILLDTLAQYGYTKNVDPCFLQSFNEDSIRYMKGRSSLPAIMLLVNGPTDDRLDELAQFCYGIGPRKDAIVQIGENGSVSSRTDLIQRAHARGLKVHAWTFRNEDRFLAWDYGQDSWEEYEDFLNMEVDGLFTDFPATYLGFLNKTYSGC